MEHNDPNKKEKIVFGIVKKDPKRVQDSAYSEQPEKLIEVENFRTQARKNLNLGLFADVKKDMERLEKQGIKREVLVNSIKDHALRVFEASAKTYANGGAFDLIERDRERLAELGIYVK